MKYRSSDNIKAAYVLLTKEQQHAAPFFNAPMFSELRTESERISRLVLDWPYADRDLETIIRQIIMNYCLRERLWPGQDMVLAEFNTKFKENNMNAKQKAQEFNSNTTQSWPDFYHQALAEGYEVTALENTGQGLESCHPLAYKDPDVVESYGEKGLVAIFM